MQFQGSFDPTPALLLGHVPRDYAVTVHQELAQSHGKYLVSASSVDSERRTWSQNSKERRGYFAQQPVLTQLRGFLS